MRPRNDETPASVGALDRGDIAGSGELETGGAYGKDRLPVLPEPDAWARERSAAMLRDLERAEPCSVTGAGVVRLTPAGYRATGRPGIALYLEEPFLSLDDEAEALRRTLYKAAHGCDEWAERCDRMLSEACGRFIPAEVYRFARAAGLTAAGVVYGRTSEDRLRRADLLAEIATEAQAVEAELSAA